MFARNVLLPKLISFAFSLIRSFTGVSDAALGVVRARCSGQGAQGAEGCLWVPHKG